MTIHEIRDAWRVENPNAPITKARTATVIEKIVINEFIIMQTLFTLKWAGNLGVRVDFVSSNQRTS